MSRLYWVKMIKMRINTLGAVFFSLVMAISLILISPITFEELYLLSSTNPIWLIYIFGKLACATTLVFIIVADILNRRNKGELDEFEA